MGLDLFCVALGSRARTSESPEVKVKQIQLIMSRNLLTFGAAQEQKTWLLKVVGSPSVTGDVLVGHDLWVWKRKYSCRQKS